MLACFFVPAASQFAEENGRMGSSSPGKKHALQNEVNQVLSNGPYFENQYLSAIGHPYYKADKYVMGDVTFRGREYAGLALKYDIYNKRLIIKHPSLGFSTILPESFVDGFTIYHTRFKKIQHGTGWDYYQVIFDSSTIDCYFEWTINARESITDNNVLVPVFNKLKRKIFLSDGEKITYIKNRKALIDYFPPRQRSAVAGYIKSNQLKVRSASGEEMNDFMDFCHSISGQEKTGFSDAGTGELHPENAPRDLSIAEQPSPGQQPSPGPQPSPGLKPSPGQQLPPAPQPSPGQQPSPEQRPPGQQPSSTPPPSPTQHLSLLEHLPDYQNNQVQEQVEQQVEDHAGEQYIPTIGVSRDRVIEIGSAEQLVKGRKCRVSGKVLNRGSGEAVIGATLYIEELGLGMISSVDGSFSFSLAPGIYTLEIDHMAMQAKECGIDVISSGEVDFELEEKHIELQEVEVLYKRKSNVEGMMMGFERISSKAIKEIPVVLGEKDILKVAQMLPGVQNVGEGASGVNVRGGSPDQNLFILNHVTVYNTSHLFGFFSAFSPDIISDFSLYKNNIPAKYGGRVASIFEINTRDGNPNEFFFHGGVSPVTGHVSVEGPLVKEKLTVVASARSTYSDWLLKKVKNGDIRNSNAAFYDGSLELNATLNASNKLKFFAYQSHDEFSLSNRNDYAYRNLGSSLSWDHTFGDDFTSHLAYAYSAYDFSNTDKNNISEAFRQEYRLDQHEARLDFVKPDLHQHRIEFGFGSILYRLNRGDIMPFGEASHRMELHLGTEYGLEHALYLSDEFRLFQRLGVLVGMRYSYYQALGPQQVDIYREGSPKLYYNVLYQEEFSRGEVLKTYNGLEPRLTFNYRLTRNSSVKASYNRLHQYIFLLSNTIAVAPTDQWKLCDYHLLPPRSDQFSVGYYQDLPKHDINLSAETYYKKTDHIAEFRDGADFISGEPTERLVLQGEQDSYGLELMAKKNGGRLSGWLSYTWSRSIVSVDGPEKAMQINNGRPYPSNFDRPHSFNMISNFRLNRRISLSLNAVYMSGRPVTLPVSFYFTEKQQYLYYSERNAYRIPDYFRIDFSLNLEGNLKFKKPAHSFWMLNIYNVTGRNNAYSVFYESKNGRVRGYQLSIFAQPIVTVSWNLKFGNYTNE